MEKSHSPVEDQEAGAWQGDPGAAAACAAAGTVGKARPCCLLTDAEAELHHLMLKRST